jgi:hypothetical protein
MDRLRKEGAALVYRCVRQHSEPGVDKRGAKVDELTLTPLELISRIAALVPPLRIHRHRYFGVSAPKRLAAHYLWAVLIARIYEVFPLLCPICGGQMRIIAFITHSADISRTRWADMQFEDSYANRGLL